MDLDFVISGPGPFTHLDVKHPVGSAILKKQGQNTTLRKMASDLGTIISRQKKRFCDLEQGPRRGAAEFDDQYSVPKKQQSQESNNFDYDYRSNDPKNKNKSEDQCQLNENTPREINEKFESKPVKKLVKTALGNQKVKQEYEGIKKRINQGVDPIDIGKKSTNLPGNKVLIKGGHGRYLVEIFGDQVNILGIGARGNNKNMQTFQNLMNEMYNLNLQY